MLFAVGTWLRFSRGSCRVGAASFWRLIGCRGCCRSSHLSTDHRWVFRNACATFAACLFTVIATSRIVFYFSICLVATVAHSFTSVSISLAITIAACMLFAWPRTCPSLFPTAVSSSISMSPSYASPSLSSTATPPSPVHFWLSGPALPSPGSSIATTTSFEPFQPGTSPFMPAVSPRLSPHSTLYSYLPPGSSF